MDIREGTIVYGPKKDQRFEVARLLHNGSFGLVFEVHSATGERFALKTIITADLSEESLHALLNEGNLATKVTHDNVLRVLYFHDGHQYPSLPAYMLMEFADEGTLKAVLTERKAKLAHFSMEELRDFFTQLASRMKAINAVLVHRDIKPDNVLISRGRLKIADFPLCQYT